MNAGRHIPLAFAVAIGLTVSAAPRARSQPPPIRIEPRDTLLVASTHYGASSFHRRLYGDNYRDLWEKPIRVPVLDLETFAGGLQAVKEGGGNQTKNLRFTTPSGTEYVFRPVFKSLLVLPGEFNHTVIDRIFDDEMSASHPAAPLIAAPFLEATGVLHASPLLVMMPNDPSLGEFRKDFGGVLGMIEESPGVPDDAPGFGGAVEIIDSDKLLERLNKDAREHIDARGLLTARLVDLLLGDNDRHPGQWKWAKLRPGKDAPWEPIPRDRDKVVVSYEGMALGLARKVEPTLVQFNNAYPDLSGLFHNAIEFDRRLLGGLDKTVWDSVVKSVGRRVSDSVIDAALRGAHAEYQSATPELVAKLRARRVGLPNAADRYFHLLFAVADIHATDAADRATIQRSADGIVDVRISSDSGPAYLVRRFDVRDTKEIRLYLHGGDDSVVVSGTARAGPFIRIIGGNGTNTLLDSATGGHRRLERLYDEGRVARWSYKSDTVATVVYQPDTSWNRQPWMRAYGKPSAPQRDRGLTLTPRPGLKTGAGLGFTPSLALTRTAYGFRTYPYASKMSLLGAYSFGTTGYKLELTTDNRRESSPVHVLTDAMISQIELVEFHGFGNDAPDARVRYNDVRQTVWRFHPAVGLSLNPRSDLTLGPVVKYVSTDSAPGHFIAQYQPRGVGGFGQAGLQLDARYDTRDNPGFPERGVFLLASASAYPVTWSGRSGGGGAFEQVGATASTYMRVPLLTRAVLALRGGARKVFGDFPYYEAAFIGGSSTVRTYHYRESAGDASLFGNAELRLPVAKFAFLLPLNLGLLGFSDAGRVYMDSRSPGAWHTAAGAGFWLGALNPSTSVTVLFTNRRENRVSLGIGFNY